MFFDAHADIWTDVSIKREKGKTSIIKKEHLPRLKIGGVESSIFVIWIDPFVDNNSKLSIYKIIESISNEIIECKEDISIIRRYEEIEKAKNEGKIAVLIGVEGISFISENEIDFIDTLYVFGVRHLSLTWNEENTFATGISGNPYRGVTENGYEVLEKIKDLGVILDVSHLNERSFWDVYNNYDMPFIASHSNSKHICNVKRNLNDKQLKAIADKGGVVGINAVRDFIHKDSTKQNIDMLVNHIDYIVSIIGIDHVGFGFDFCDYLDMDDEDKSDENNSEGVIGFENITKTHKLVRILNERGYNKNDIEKLKYKNFHRIIKKILK